MNYDWWSYDFAQNNLEELVPSDAIKPQEYDNMLLYQELTNLEEIFYKLSPSTFS